MWGPRKTWSEALTLPCSRAFGAPALNLPLNQVNMGNVVAQAGREDAPRDDSDDEARGAASSPGSGSVPVPSSKRTSILRTVRERSVRGRAKLQHSLETLARVRPKRDVNQAHFGQVQNVLLLGRLFRSNGRPSKSVAAKLAVSFLP